MLQKISALSQNQADDYDKLQDANVQLLNYIKKNSINPQMMKAPLKEACVNGLTAFVSDDKKVRCYSWDTLTGGTMHFFYSLISYDAGNSSFKLKVLNPNDKETEEDPGSCFEGLDTIKTKDGKTVYLIRDLFIGSGMIHGRTITAYVVANGKLVEYPFFQTSKKTLKSINFGFGEYSDATEFVLSPDKKTLRVPLIKPTPDETGAATGKYLTYAFDGSRFVFKK
ncbi:MAG: hypothetical protein SFY67_18990 [Candidatus Melainabacteria bacterium]|nr:hypothetical protein [Candidatus Melainabacteria bacterium]